MSEHIQYQQAKCECHNCMWLRAGALERALIPNNFPKLEAERDQLKTGLQKFKEEKLSLRGNETLCPACESPCVATQRMGGEMYLAHPVYACPKDLVEESNQLRARVERLEKVAEAANWVLPMIIGYPDSIPLKNLQMALAALRDGEPE